MHGFILTPYYCTYLGSLVTYLIIPKTIASFLNKLFDSINTLFFSIYFVAYLLYRRDTPGPWPKYLLYGSSNLGRNDTGINDAAKIPPAWTGITEPDEETIAAARGQPYGVGKGNLHSHWHPTTNGNAIWQSTKSNAIQQRWTLCAMWWVADQVCGSCHYSPGSGNANW